MVQESQDNIFNSQTQSSYVGLSMCSNIMPHSDALNEDYDVNTQVIAFLSKLRIEHRSKCLVMHRV